MDVIVTSFFFSSLLQIVVDKGSFPSSYIPCNILVRQENL